jgi:hypothetical protein
VVLLTVCRVGRANMVYPHIGRNINHGVFISAQELSQNNEFSFTLLGVIKESTEF